MFPVIKRFLGLLFVFALFFFLVTGIRTCRTADDFSSLIPSFFRKQESTRPEAFTPSDRPPLNLSDVEMISRLNEEYARLTNAVVPSVVSIDTSGYRTERSMDVWGQSRVRNYPTQGQGSGAIVSKEGHIVTNHHVIAGQQKLRITLHGGKTYSATMIGEDPLLDIAVIKIDSTETFTPLKLGDSSLVKVGQLVLAVGNPFGLGETVTQGIISAKERSLSDNQRDLFQTDAAINPGNSGGPLVNLTGEIIGINAAIFSVDKEKPSFQGVGFSIPSNDVREALEQIIKRGRPIRGFLGVQMRDLDSIIATELNYPQGTGSAVIGITPGSPAEAAGLQASDIIMSYDGKSIKDTAQLISLVQRTKIQEKVKVEVWRSGGALTLEATITEATTSPLYQEIPQKPPTKDNLKILRSIGVETRDLSPYELLRGYRGVVVTKILSAAQADGILRPGDLITGLNNTPITSSNQFYLNLAASAAIQVTTVTIVRGNSQDHVSIPKAILE